MTFCGWELFLLIAGGYLRQQMQVLDIVPISLAENMLHAINLRIDYKGRCMRVNRHSPLNFASA